MNDLALKHKMNRTETIRTLENKLEEKKVSAERLNFIQMLICKKQQNDLTERRKSGRIITVIALQKPVRPAAGGEPAGSPLFISRK